MGYGNVKKKKKKKMSFGSGGSTNKKPSYTYGGMTGSNRMTVKQFRHGGMCKRGM